MTLIQPFIPKSHTMWALPKFVIYLHTRKSFKSTNNVFSTDFCFSSTLSPNEHCTNLGYSYHFYTVHFQILSTFFLGNRHIQIYIIYYDYYLCKLSHYMRVTPCKATWSWQTLALCSIYVPLSETPQEFADNALRRDPSSSKAPWNGNSMGMIGWSSVNYSDSWNPQMHQKCTDF